MPESEKWQLEGPNPSSAVPMGTGELRALGGTGACGVSMSVSGLCLAAGLKAAGAGPDVEPPLSQVTVPMGATWGGMGALVAA